MLSPSPHSTKPFLGGEPFCQPPFANRLKPANLSRFVWHPRTQVRSLVCASCPPHAWPENSVPSKWGLRPLSRYIFPSSSRAVTRSLAVPEGIPMTETSTNPPSNWLKDTSILLGNYVKEGILKLGTTGSDVVNTMQFHTVQHNCTTFHPYNSIQLQKFNHAIRHSTQF